MEVGKIEHYDKEWCSGGGCHLGRTAEEDLLELGYLSQTLRDELNHHLKGKREKETCRQKNSRCLDHLLSPLLPTYPTGYSQGSSKPCVLRTLPAQPACVVLSLLRPPPALYLFPTTYYLTICWVVLRSDGSCGYSCLLNKFCKPIEDRGCSPHCTPHHICHSAGAELTWAALK